MNPTPMMKKAHADFVDGGSIQPEKRNSKGQSGSMWAQTHWKNLTRPLWVWRDFSNEFALQHLAASWPFQFAFRVEGFLTFDLTLTI